MSGFLRVLICSLISLPIIVLAQNLPGEQAEVEYRQVSVGKGLELLGRGLTKEIKQDYDVDYVNGRLVFDRRETPAHLPIMGETESTLALDVTGILAKMPERPASIADLRYLTKLHKDSLPLEISCAFSRPTREGKLLFTGKEYEFVASKSAWGTLSNQAVFARQGADEISVFRSTDNEGNEGIVFTVFEDGHSPRIYYFSSDRTAEWSSEQIAEYKSSKFSHLNLPGFGEAESFLSMAPKNTTDDISAQEEDYVYPPTGVSGLRGPTIRGGKAYVFRYEGTKWETVELTNRGFRFNRNLGKTHYTSTSLRGEAKANGAVNLNLEILFQ